MNAKPETDVDTLATVSATRPIPCPATKKSFAVRVRLAAQTLMATITAKYASATVTIVGLPTCDIGPAVAPPFWRSRSPAAVIARLPRAPRRASWQHGVHRERRRAARRPRAHR